MIHTSHRLLCFVVLLVFIPRNSGAQVSSLGWMTGCWESQRGKSIVIEQWSRPRAGMMFGYGQTIRADSTTDYEQTRIFERGGKTIYGAHPAGQEPAEFVAEGISATSVLFANPAHDFPQRVSYRRLTRDSLAARVEGNTRSGPRGTDFRYRRIACAR